MTQVSNHTFNFLLVKFERLSARGKFVHKHFNGEQFTLHRIPLKETDIPTAIVGKTILEHDTAILIADGGKFYAVSDFLYEEELFVDKNEFELFTDTYDIRDAKPKAMFAENHRYNEHTCSPMPMNINPFQFQPVYRVNESLMMIRPVFEKDQLSFSMCQPRQESSHTSPLDHEDSWGAINICEDLTPSVNYAQSCTCPSGFANIRYVDNNQPFSLHGGCSTLPGDSKGLFVDYKKCHGRNDCQQYRDTPYSVPTMTFCVMKSIKFVCSRKWVARIRYVRFCFL